MSGQKRGFRLSPAAAAFVDDAKVVTDAAPDAPAQGDPVQHSTLPWEDLSAGTRGINFTPTPELYAKMAWCKQNVPQMSSLKILRIGAEMYCDQLIAKYFKPDEE